MNSQSVDAVFKDGVFRPLDPLRIDVREGEQVRLRIEDAGQTTSVELAEKVYEGLSASEISEIERIALDRSAFFGHKEAD